MYKQDTFSCCNCNNTTSVFVSVLNIDDKVRDRDSQHIDTDSSVMVCDNSANVYVCNHPNMYVEDLSPVKSHRVVTIGGKGHAPSGIGTIRWSWCDGQGKKHEYLVENVLHFPESPINILSVTEFAKQLDNTEGTDIDTKQLRSQFYWENNKFTLAIQHPASNIPGAAINEGFLLSRI